MIIIILMRKYYTLVKNGRQEGGGAGKLEVPALLPAFWQYNRLFLTAERLLFFQFIYYYCQGHFLNSESHRRFTCIAVLDFEHTHYYSCFKTPRDHFHPILQFILCNFPLQLPCLLQQSLTQMYMYTFGCFSFDSTSACTTQHTHKSLSLWLMAWLSVTWTSDVLRQSHPIVNANKMYLSTWDHWMSGANSDTTLNIYGSASQHRSWCKVQNPLRFSSSYFLHVGWQFVSESLWVFSGEC